MIGHALDAAFAAGAERAVVVVGYQRRAVEQWVREAFPDRPVKFVVQDEQLGTAHAVWSAREFLESGPERTLIQYGDVPAMDGETLRSFVETAEHSRAPLALMTARPEENAEYGRILRDEEDDVLGVVEYADATPRQREIDEVNAGFYVADTPFLTEHLPRICSGAAETAQEEYYLPDLVEIAVESEGAHAWECPEAARIHGVNTRTDLAEVTDAMRRRINRTWMEAGVTMIDPSATYVEPEVELSRDVVLYPDVHLRGETVVGEGTVVENGSVLRDAKLAADVHIKPHCFVEEAEIDSGTNVGPSAHLRPGADVGRNCKVGNYVEVKKARLEDGVKAGHLTYLGDAHVGEGANIGAGTITCNYDGEEKHETRIGPRAFIGSNSSLVAPVEIGERAYVGAGSTITEDVPDRALGVGRGRQRNIEEWAEDE